MAYDFNTIAQAYDRMNHLMTLGLDRLWRQRAVRGLQGNVLDVACGTGDLSICLAKQGCSVIGVDLSEQMLRIAQKKAPTITFQLADVENLPFADATFDAVTCAFGVRNFIHLKKGLNEMLRVLTPGGKLVILELATPDSKLVKPFYDLYTKHIIPWLGMCFAGSREAYTYLPLSIERFPKGDAFLNIAQQATNRTIYTRHHKLTFGVCRMYVIEC